MALFRRIGTAFRTDPGSGQRGRAVQITDPWGGDAVTQQIASLVSNPAGWVKVCQQESTNGRLFPYNGATNVFGATATGGATVVQLAAAACNVGAGAGTFIDPTGLGVIVTGSASAAKGDFRLISGWANSGIRSVNLVDMAGTARGISGNIGASDTYELVYPVLWDTDVMLKHEFSAIASSAPSAEVRIWCADLGRTLGDVQRAPIWTPDLSLLTVVNLDKLGSTSVPTEETSFYHGGLLMTRAKGLSAIKIEHVTKPASGTMTSWLASS